MGWFRQKKAGSRSAVQFGPVEPGRAEAQPIDTFLGDEQLAAAHQALVQGDWRDAEALIVQRRGCSRSIRRLSSSDVPVTAIEAWHEASPSPCTMTILASALLDYGRAQTNDPEARRGTATRAEALLWASIPLNPISPESWALLISTGVELGFDQDELQRRFNQAHQRAPFHPAAVRARVHALSPRVGGSTIGLREFARWVVKESPAGSPALGAVVEAQFEIALDRCEGEGENVSPMSLMNSADNIRQAQDALEKLLEGVHGSDPQAAAPIEIVEALNWLLFWVSPTNPRSADLNRRGFAALKNRVAAAPWNMFGPNRDQPVVAFNTTRAHRLRMCDQVGALYSSDAAAATLSPAHAHLTPTAQRIAETHARQQQSV